MNDLMASLIAVILGASVLWSATDGLQVVTTEGARRAEVRESPAPVPEVRLEMMDGTTEGLIGTDGRLRLVEFIYTSCPTICRSSGADLAQLRDRLKSEGYAGKVRVLSISFDPQTDQVDHLRAYGELHGADHAIWSVARPRQDDLEALLKAFGVIVIPDGFGGYQHNAAIRIVSPSGRLSAILDTSDIDGALTEIARILG